MSTLGDPETVLGEFSTKEAAALLGVHPKTLKEWVRAGKVRAVITPGNHYRFRRVDLDELARTSLTQPDTETAS